MDLIKRLCLLRNFKVSDADDPSIVLDSKGGRIKFFICGNEKLDMAYFYKAYESLEKGICHLIFIYNFATIQIKKLKLYKDVLQVEFFNTNELTRLLVGNRFIPKHRQVEPMERDIIFQKFGKENLPLICLTDPIVKLHNFEIDEVIEIEREGGLYYRLVVMDD